MIIDGKDLLLGRFATHVAKKALLGEEIVIVNCDKIIISGKKENVLAKYKTRRARGAPLKGPYYPRQSDRFVRRAIRGMLPYKQPKGKAAFKRIMCYSGIPASYQDEKKETIKSANVSKLPKFNYISVGEICKFLGGKQ